MTAVNRSMVIGFDCPWCGEAAGQPCRDAAGEVVPPHAARKAARVAARAAAARRS